MLGEDDAERVAAALARTGGLAAALLAAEAVGAAGGALAGSVQRGGRPAGPRTAPDRLAEVYVQVQAARSAAYYAAWETGSAPPDEPVPPYGQLALAQALEAQRLAAGEAVQSCGISSGTALLYFRRAAGDELLFGPAHRLRAHAASRSALLTEVAH